ncbi:MAG: DNA recombination protein RmuC [Cellulomonadaceae bacterium]|jgi:DNA recombination protein RmuC|nr:DNA recombination protein RmuC [Cellulomonadaceae bacterium]
MTTTAWLIAILAALIIGGVAGWLLHAVRSRADSRDTAQMRAEVEELRHISSISALVEPMKRSLEQVQAQVERAEVERVRTHSALAQHLRLATESSDELRRETGTLVTALRAPQTRGSWGEMHLRRVVEAAGMLNHVDFDEQVSVRSVDGVLRPDMVVRLAGGKSIVVDSKVALVGYLDAHQTEDPVRREERLDAHVRHLRKHIDDLASKKYWSQFASAPEFVVMFVPAESFLSAASERDADLLEFAARKNVVIATPMTLIALLRTVAYAWRQEALAQNAQEVLDTGKTLYSRLGSMASHIGKTGKALESASKAYNAMVGSLERQVLPSARRLVHLDIVDEDPRLDHITGVEEPPRLMTQPELLAGLHVVREAA